MLKDAFIAQEKRIEEEHRIAAQRRQERIAANVFRKLSYRAAEARHSEEYRMAEADRIADEARMVESAVGGLSSADAEWWPLGAPRPGMI